MIRTERWYGQYGQLASLLAATSMALWLLVRPELVSGLPLGLRLPVWLLGLWAVGSGFFHGMGLVKGTGWRQRLLGAPLCWVLLAVFLLLLLVRS
ncbi:hypothetical protein SAMN02745148_00018 [Modicisalibacter ilicicola DSM 19980]|uniref:Cyd operon protein YbgE n=1 Tax=Modicisalibacter ilicicola DSM 19980 TaxID=1121942 RepID=A0A1M4S8V6_9GAMM|nr:cyd operon YbgE family protein [Halomonas ilicicola]SHE28653.1 hypothetical protein SAMN02745148_00018 [Halomonas ilicicola DSM 19980]